MSPPPPRKSNGNGKGAGNHASPAAVGDLQSLVDQVQSLRRRHKARPSNESAAELARLREALLAAIDLDDDDDDDDPPESNSQFEDDDGELTYTSDMDDEIWEEDESGEWRSRRDWTRFKPAKRIPVDDGLELRSRRGAIGESWWSRRFLSAVESILTGGRLTRGRTYARQGQVIDLGIGAGLAVAQVQGSRRTPYGVQISMPAASDGRWAAIVDALAAQAGYAARLLAGHMPHEIEEVFAGAGVALFPERGSQLTTTCTCPDWATPCKHAAAVCYLMAEAFDDDPFLLLAFRGRNREGLLAELRAKRGVADPTSPNGTISTGTIATGHPASHPASHSASGADGTSPGAPGAEPTAPASPLIDDIARFWHSGPELAEVHCLPRATDAPGAVLRLLPKGVLTLRGKEVADMLETAYGRLTTAAEKRAFEAGAPAKPGART